MQVGLLVSTKALGALWWEAHLVVRLVSQIPVQFVLLNKSLSCCLFLNVRNTEENSPLASAPSAAYSHDICIRGGSCTDLPLRIQDCNRMFILPGIIAGCLLDSRADRSYQDKNSNIDLWHREVLVRSCNAGAKK